jgi:lysophospholipase L1-like esterase
VWVLRFPRSSRLALGVIAAIAVAGCGTAAGLARPGATGSPSADATQAVRPGGGVSIPNADSRPRQGRPWLLTIGDSITYGYTEDPARAGVNSGWPVQLMALLATSGRSWQLVDTACPGETLVTYRTGCPEAIAAGLGGETQHDLALQDIEAHRGDLRAIFVDLGSNDLLEAYRTGAASNPAAVIDQMGRRLDDILVELRAAAPGVPIIVANYYDPLANSDPSTLTAVAAANAMVGATAANNGDKVADFAAAINTAPPPDPHLCDYVDCLHLDIHPTIAGHAALAAVAFRVLTGEVTTPGAPRT